jgi:hypothetical protein
MKKIILACTVVLIADLGPCEAQKIENETAARDRVVRVQTALHHLTVIEVAEPVITVAVGSPEAFKIERRENKVFIQPLEENVATNLFIWTASTRLNYELIPAISDAGQMDFAIDYRPPQPQASVAKKTESDEADRRLPDEILLKSTPVRLAGTEPKSNPGLLIRDIYRKDNEIFIRYSIENRSEEMLNAGDPVVSSLTGVTTRKALSALHNAQLGSDFVAKMRTGGSPVPVRIIRTDSAPTTELAPGSMHVGLIAVELPGSDAKATADQPTVLQIQLPTDRAGTAVATLVL